MSYKHLEDIQNIYENISEPIDQNFIDEATAVLIDSMLSQGFSENAILEYAGNADANEVLERILDASEDYVLVEDITVPLLSTLNEDVDPNKYLPEELELSIEHTQSIERLHEGVGRLLTTAVQKVGNLGLAKKAANLGLAKKAGNLIKRVAGKGPGTTKQLSLNLNKGKKTLLQRAGDTVKKVAKNPLAQGALGGLGVMAGVPLAVGGVRLAAKGAKAIGGAIKKGVDTAKTFVKGGADAVKDKNISKQVDDYVARNKGDKPIRKIDPTPYNRQEKPKAEPKKAEPKVATPPVQPKKKMHSIEKKNRARFGDAHVDKLKAKNADFKLMRKGTMSKDDFIKKYPNSITAQKAAGLRDHAEWDAFDIVSNYLIESNQVENMDEALYVMSEMDATTIQGIVSEYSIVE